MHSHHPYELQVMFHPTIRSCILEHWYRPKATRKMGADGNNWNVFSYEITLKYARLHGIISLVFTATVMISWNVTNLPLRCKILGFLGGDYEEWRLLGCYAVWLL
jgi:hypothetical protein